ncbi:MAG: beta-ketoacyl synthase chain length factor [Thiomicrorhabdus sp.]|nr:beta-ketoacyl synthase chain length factor [Thiomicrorhabdus sp.]
MTTSTLKAQILSVGMTAPSIIDFQTFKVMLQANEAFDLSRPLEKYSPAFLPSNERRRTTQTIKIALKTAEEALSHFKATYPSPDTQIPVLFVCKDGDSMITAKICQAVSDEEPTVSPTQFHNSVHNAPAGYWMIGQSNQAAASAISVGEHAVANGLLEAILQSKSEKKPVLVVIYDLPLDTLIPVDSSQKLSPPFAFSLILDANVLSQSSELPSLSLLLNQKNMESPALESNPYEGLPAAQGYPLLKAIAQYSPEAQNSEMYFSLNSNHLMKVSLT